MSNNGKSLSSRISMLERSQEPGALTWLEFVAYMAGRDSELSPDKRRLAADTYQRLIGRNEQD